MTTELVADLVAKIVAAEREACAKAAEANLPENEPGEYAEGRFAAARDIRARPPISI